MKIYKKNFFRSVFFLFVAMIFFGCSKASKQSPEQQAEQKVTAKQEAQFEQHAWEKLPSAPFTIQAIKYLKKLNKNGQLPDTEDARHSIEFSKQAYSTNYPMVRTFALKMQHTSEANHYTVEKQSADAAWQIQKAWRTDNKGKIIKIYIVLADGGLMATNSSDPGVSTPSNNPESTMQ